MRGPHHRTTATSGGPERSESGFHCRNQALTCQFIAWVDALTPQRSSSQPVVITSCSRLSAACITRTPRGTRGPGVQATTGSARSKAHLAMTHQPGHEQATRATDRHRAGTGEPRVAEGDRRPGRARTGAIAGGRHALSVRGSRRAMGSSSCGRRHPGARRRPPGTRRTATCSRCTHWTWIPWASTTRYRPPWPVSTYGSTPLPGAC